MYSMDMIEIIPAIIAKNFQELTEKIQLVEPYVRWVQLDIMDGKFVPNTAWNKPKDLETYNPRVFLEAHLMIEYPEKHAESWMRAGIKRIIFHIEAAKDPHALIALCRTMRVDVGVAVSPQTSVEKIKDLLGVVDMVLVLGVTPGFAGQRFKPSVLPKIRELRKASPYLTIGVDGGMDPKTAKQAVEAGANVIVAGSFIFGSNNIEKAINELRNVEGGL